MVKTKKPVEKALELIQWIVRECYVEAAVRIALDKVEVELNKELGHDTVREPDS